MSNGTKAPVALSPRKCPSVVARRVGRRALASSSASRASVVALGAHGRRATARRSCDTRADGPRRRRSLPACASSSASRASVVALGADERRAAGAAFLRHAGGRGRGGVVASLACASSSRRMKIDVIEHILRFLGADPLDFVMALDEDAQHARDWPRRRRRRGGAI